MKDTILIKNGTVVTLGDKNRVLTGHSVLIEGGLIKKIGKNSEFKGKYAKVIDASGKIVMPGFINAHMHFYSTMVRGLGKAKPSKNFQEVLENLWWRLDKKLTVEDSYYSTLVPSIAAIKCGTTTLIDHHASPFAIHGSLDAVAAAVKAAGLRASLCYELSDRDGAAISQEGHDENVDFIKRCKKEKDPQLAALFGLHAAFTLSNETLEKASDAAASLGAGFHVHVAEAKSDEDFNVKKYKLRVVERLHKFGILGPKTIAAHCVHINDKEAALLAKTGTAVVTNPQSNQNNAVGIADIIGLTKKGILVGLGSDAMTVNMFEELRACMWGQHLRNEDPCCGFMEVMSTLPFNNAKIANRYFPVKVGVLKEGYAADVILMDYYPPTPFNENTFLGHLGFGLSQSYVDTTIASGKVLMENKKLKIDIDEEEVAAKSMELSAALWERF